MAKGQDIDNKVLDSALHIAAKNGHKEAVEWLIKRGGNIHFRQLHDAAKYGHITVIELLLSRGIDINARGFENKSAFRYAVEGGQTETVEWLLGREAEVNVNDWFQSCFGHVPI